MKLTAKDLMVGDYVFAPNRTYSKVTGVGKAIQLDKTTLLEEVEPIPLTPEILEKNGFALVEVGDNGSATPKKNYNRYERWECKTMWCDISIWFDRITKKWCLHGLNSVSISYVHELQHAFKFCKIEKDIEL